MKAELLLLQTIFLGIAKSSRILVVFNIPSKSHFILGNALAKGLAEAGHNVTMVSFFEDKNSPKNGTYRNVVLTDPDQGDNKQEAINFLDIETMNPFLYINWLNNYGYTYTKYTMDDPNFQKLLKSNEHFDVVIIEQFINDALKVLAHHYKAPLISFSTLGANTWVNYFVGNPAPPSYVPEFLLDYTNDMTFYQRLYNWIFVAVSELNQHFIVLPAQNKLVHQYFPDAPDLDEFLYNISLVLLNSHESVNQPVPHVPNMIDIGGYHISPPKELPKDLKKFMDDAKEGVVYFSMGTLIKPSHIAKPQIKALLRAFSKLKQKVLWKWDGDRLEEKPDNVKIGKWFPQSDVLAHPNTQLFITHGGLLSTTETIYHGVPTLVIPIFGDQKMNAANAVMGGYGLSLRLSELTEENQIVAALDELLKNPKYRNNARRRSKLIHDRPVKPLDLAVYWIEFVIRNGGASHLKVAGLDLPWYKYLLLDVALFVTLVSVFVISIFFKVIVKLFCKRTSTGTSTRGKIKKNN